MPKRLDSDPEHGMLRIYRQGAHLVIEPGDGQSFRVSEYTAARICGTLSLFLNLRFVRRHAERLTL